MRQLIPTSAVIVSERFGRRISAAAAAATLLALAGCAEAGPYNPSQLAPTDRAQVAGLCSGVIGLPAGNQQYNACLEALSSSVHDLSGAHVLSASQNDCLRQGLPPGSPALARCELDRSRAAAGSATYAVLPAADPIRTEPARTYWAASNAEVHRREETACASLGLEPAGYGFGQCVASLDIALFAATNMQQ